jgi:hypothetical protein
MLTRRETETSAPLTGIYATIMDVMTNIAIITNCALISFTTASFGSTETRLVIFLVLEVRFAPVQSISSPSHV